MILDHTGRPAVLDQPGIADLVDSMARIADQNVQLQESNSRLEFELQQAGWAREAAQGAQEPDRDTLRRAIDLARYAYLKNPLPRRGVDLQASYVFAQGFNVKANDESFDTVIKDFMQDAQNQRAMFSADVIAQRDRELSLDGSLFIAFFANRSTGRVKLSTVPVPQVTRVISNPENAEQPWFYLREWTAEGFDMGTGLTPAEGMQAYYPDIGFNPEFRPDQIGGIKVKWDTPILHVKVGGFSDWKFGFPETEVSRPYATAVMEFLSNWASVMKALARFSWKGTGMESAAETAAVKGKLNTTVSTLSPGLSIDSNPPPVTGSTALIPKGRDLTPIPTRNAAPSSDEVRQLRIMAIAASGFGDHFYGDAQQGSLATANSLDRPTELRIRSRQAFWAGVFRQIFNMVLLWAVRAPSGALRKLGKVQLRDPSDPDAMPRVVWKKNVDPTINIDWPRIVEPIIENYVNALMQAAPMLPEELVSQLLMVVFEVDGIDKWLETWKQERAKAKAEAAAIAMGQTKQTNTNPTDKSASQPTELPKSDKPQPTDTQSTDLAAA